MSNFIPNFPTTNTPIPQFKTIVDNWNALNTQFGTDHAPFTETIEEKKGHHKQVFYNEPIAAPAPIPTGTQAVSFPRASVGIVPNITQEIYQNVRGPNPNFYLMSCVKGWGFVGSNGVLADGFNVTSAGAGGNYTISFIIPLPSNNYAVIVSSKMDMACTFGAIAGIDSQNMAGFQVNTRSLTSGSPTPQPFYFVVLQT